MSRDTDLEIRLRSAAMAPGSSHVSVQREELVADLSELIELRCRLARDLLRVETSLQRHPSAAEARRTS